MYEDLCVCMWAGSIWDITKVCLKTRKNTPPQPFHLPFSFLPCPSIISQTDCSSRPKHTLTITLPLTLKRNLPSTLTFPTLTDFLGELEHFSRLLSLFLRKWLLSLAACILAWCFFLLALSITLLTLLHRESIHLFGWGVAILWVIYTSYSVQACEIVEGGGLYLE